GGPGRARASASRGTARGAPRATAPCRASAAPRRTGPRCSPRSGPRRRGGPRGGSACGSTRRAGWPGGGCRCRRRSCPARRRRPRRSAPSCERASRELLGGGVPVRHPPEDGLGGVGGEGPHAAVGQGELADGILVVTAELEVEGGLWRG